MPRQNLRRALTGATTTLLILALGACSGEEAGVPVAPTGEVPGTSVAEAGPGDTSPTPTTAAPDPGVRTIVATFARGAPLGGSRTETVALDEPVRIEVDGDAVDQVHIHTYDLVRDVSPGAVAVFEFTADIPGVHEVELHDTGQILFELQVEP